MSEIQSRVWETEQEILDVFDDVCVKNGLKYTLAYGTLIGAVRHKGFIPWDDDIDVIMPRSDYNRLLSIWNDVAPKGYLLQNAKTDLDLTNNFSKIRKDHTAFVQYEYEKEKKYHKGIFIDIFPCDAVAESSVGKKIQYFFCALNLLYNRGHGSGSKGLIGLLEKVLLLAPKAKYKKLENWAEKHIIKYNLKPHSSIFVHDVIEDCKAFYPADSFKSLIKLEFNGKEYCAIENYDLWLKAQYGDYMQLPPEEERTWKHHPILIDFDNNYEELVQRQKD